MRLAPALAIALLGCAPSAEPLRFRIVRGADDDPYRGADTLAIALEQNGAVLAGSEQLFDVAETDLVLEQLPFGTALAIRVEARAGGLVLARGRSFPFDYPSPGAPPGGSADVLLGTLGRFVTTVDAPLGAPRAAIANPRGALVATDTELRLYVAHDDGDATARADAVVGLDPALRGARWAPLAGGLVAVTGDRAALWDERGAPVADRTLSSAPIAIGSIAQGGAVVGVAADGTVSTLELDGDGLVERVQAAIDPLDEATIAGITVRAATGDERHALVVGRSRAWLVDPGRGSVDVQDLGASRAGRLVIAVAPGVALVAGGRDDAGVATRDAMLLSVLPGRDPVMQPITPAPEPLFDARSEGTILEIAPSIFLIAGGVGDGGAPLAHAELRDLTVLVPGDAVATGALTHVAAAPAMAMLRDGTVLAATPGGVGVYVPPRGD